MNENVLIHKLIEIIQYKDTYQRQSSGIQPQDMYVLERIFFNETIKIRDISIKYSIPPSTLTGIIDRLETKKYIQRIRTDDDRRSIKLTPTEDGKEIVQKHIKEDKIFSYNFFNTLEKEEKDQLLKLLGKLVDSVRIEDLFKESLDLI